MKFNGKINSLNHIVISDPSYENGIWCRYENDKIDNQDWLVNLDISSVEDKIGDYNVKGIEFVLLLKQNEKDCDINEKGSLSYSNDINIKDYEIGIDTACVAMGVNDKAKQIINSRDEWQPSCSIRTGSDGIFGEVYEGKRNDKLSFLLITGYFEEDFINQKQLFDYLKEQFEIIDLIKDEEVEL